MMHCFIEQDAQAVPVELIPASDLDGWITDQPEDLRNWAASTGFTGKAGSVSLIAGADGALARVLFAHATDPGIWDWAPLPAELPDGTYRIEGEAKPADLNDLALAWGMNAYAFIRYKSEDKPKDSTGPVLVWPEDCDRDGVVSTAEATNLVRDLINTPASDMGPPELAAAAADLASSHEAEYSVIEGDDLLDQNFPAIHAVGRAHDRAPRLIDIRWGASDAPKVTLVGKGVCFDTGGLDIKSTAGMKLMKKDMGGAAHVLGIAAMVMDAALPIRLRVLVPAVENSISANAMRPGDVVPTRHGQTIEIGNTDAEGRVILADALFEAASEAPELIVDFATLTGAARVALGTDLPALFCNDDIFATALLEASTAVGDPLWRMPLWAGYDKQVNGKIADLTNAPEGGYGGAITAALFLQRFVTEPISWAHIDVMAWNIAQRPGRPEGGEAMGVRAVFEALRARFAP